MHIDVAELLTRRNEQKRREAESTVEGYLSSIVNYLGAIKDLEKTIAAHREKVAEFQKKIKDFSYEPLDSKEILGE